MQRKLQPRPFCPIVCPSVKCVLYDGIKENCAQIFIPHEKKTFILFSLQVEWFLGDDIPST